MLKSEKINGLINDGQSFLGKGYTSSNPEFKAWNADLIRLIEKTYGVDSTDAKRFKQRLYSPCVVYSGMSNNEFNKTFESDLKASIEELKRLEKEIDEEKLLPTDKKSGSKQSINVNVNNIINNNINLSCGDIRMIIEDNSMIGDAEKEELLDKLNEIEDLQKSNLKKTEKWKVAKEILKFIIDKGADIAIMYIPQILKALG